VNDMTDKCVIQKETKAQWKALRSANLTRKLWRDQGQEVGSARFERLIRIFTNYFEVENETTKSS